MDKANTYQWAFVVRGVDIYRDAEIFEVLGHLPQLLGSSSQRIGRKILLRDAQRVLRSGVSADQLWAERQRLDPACEPAVDHIAASEPVVHKLANPPGHHQQILVLFDRDTVLP